MRQEKLGLLAGLSRRGREETAGVDEEVSWHTTWQGLAGWINFANTVSSTSTGSMQSSLPNPLLLCLQTLLMQ